MVLTYDAETYRQVFGIKLVFSLGYLIIRGGLDNDMAIVCRHSIVERLRSGHIRYSVFICPAFLRRLVSPLDRGASGTVCARPQLLLKGDRRCPTKSSTGQYRTVTWRARSALFYERSNNLGVSAAESEGDIAIVRMISEQFRNNLKKSAGH